MLHAVETSPLPLRLYDDHAMICWICRVKSTNAMEVNVLHAKLGLKNLKVLVRECRLRYFGKVMQSSDEINWVRRRQFSGKMGSACNTKKWARCARDYLKEKGLTEKVTHDRDL